MHRRDFIGAIGLVYCAASLTYPRLSFADDDTDILDQLRSGGVSPLGKLLDPDQADVIHANLIADSMPRSDPYAIMLALSMLKDRSVPKKGQKRGELFIARWVTYGNPLLIRFFTDIGYKATSDPGDCTSWCAASVSWCLKRAGINLPDNPASSQSFLDYGEAVELSKARKGDLCVFTDIAKRGYGHVGFYNPDFKVTPDHVAILGGNQASDGATNCAAGYGTSRITTVSQPINGKRKTRTAGKYLAQVRRPA